MRVSGRITGLIDDLLIGLILAVTVAHVSHFLAQFESPGLQWISIPQAIAMDGAIARSGYLYRVYKHPCPWCLFLPKNRLVGYLLFGSLILVALEACAAFICSVVAAKSPALESAARSRSRKAGLRMALAAIFFLALAGIPAIVQRF